MKSLVSFLTRGKSGDKRPAKGSQGRPSGESGRPSAESTRSAPPGTTSAPKNLEEPVDEELPTPLKGFKRDPKKTGTVSYAPVAPVSSLVGVLVPAFKPAWRAVVRRQRVRDRRQTDERVAVDPWDGNH